jgi:hypothetical protein
LHFMDQLRLTTGLFVMEVSLIHLIILNYRLYLDQLHYPISGINSLE